MDSEQSGEVSPARPSDDLVALQAAAAPSVPGILSELEGTAALRKRAARMARRECTELYGVEGRQQFRADRETRLELDAKLLPELEVKAFTELLTKRRTAMIEANKSPGPG